MPKEGSMNRLHALVIAVLLGVAAVAGTYAAVGTTSLGVTASEATVSDAQIEARALRRAAKRKPPALPALPARRVSPSLVSAAAAPGSGAPVAPVQGPVAFRDDDHDSDDGWDDDRDDDDSHGDDSHGDDDSSGHGGGGDDDD
jgi:hypothetical protein